MNKVPLLITTDVEIAYDHDFDQQSSILRVLNDDLIRNSIPLTAFVTANFLERYENPFQSLNNNFNEIGLHGLNHNKNENYRFLKTDTVRNNILSAKDILESRLERDIKIFRGPFMSTSSLTQRILTENGFNSDFSVCSQRFDFFNSQGGNIRWLISPRMPYNPSVDNPFTKGDSRLWIVPLSCIGFPFISGVMYIFGFNFMKGLFNILLREARRNGKPIVYLFHTYEFTRSTKENHNGYKRSAIHNFYISDIKKRYQMNLSLIKYMLSFREIFPMNASKYLEELQKENKYERRNLQNSHKFDRQIF